MKKREWATLERGPCKTRNNNIVLSEIFQGFWVLRSYPAILEIPYIFLFWNSPIIKKPWISLFWNTPIFKSTLNSLLLKYPYLQNIQKPTGILTRITKCHSLSTPIFIKFTWNSHEIHKISCEYTRNFVNIHEMKHITKTSFSIVFLTLQTRNSRKKKSWFRCDTWLENLFEILLIQREIRL